MFHGDDGENSIHQRPPSARRNLTASQSNYANEAAPGGTAGRWEVEVRGETDTRGCAPQKSVNKYSSITCEREVFLRWADRSRGQEVELAPHVELS